MVKIDAVAIQVPASTTFKLNETVRFERALAALEIAVPKLGNDFTIAPEGQIRILLNFAMNAPTDGKDATLSRTQRRTCIRYLQRRLPATGNPAARLAPAMDLDEIGKSSTAKSQSRKHDQVACAGVTRHSRVTRRQLKIPLEPIMDAPSFPQPMYEALRDISQDFLFPGLEHVPANTVTLLQPNPNFVESFLVGLNAEMSHELLWRNYPTDQRGTYFQQFWDTEDDSKQDIARDHELGRSQAR